MTKNMGTADRAIRLLAGALILVLALTHVISGGLAIALGVIAVVLILTSFVGVCPAYLPLKISTLKK